MSCGFEQNGLPIRTLAKEPEAVDEYNEECFPNTTEKLQMWAQRGCDSISRPLKS